MKFPRPLVALLFIFGMLSLSGQEEPATGLWPGLNKPAQSDSTSLRIIDLHLQARGGAKAIGTVRTVQFSGELVEGKQDYSVVQTHAAPDRLRIESTRFHRGDNYVTVTATDGPQIWRQEILPKRKGIGHVGGIEKQLIGLDAMLPFLFLNIENSGHVFSYKGETTFADRPAYALHGWLSNGLQVDILFDTKSFHIINYRQPFRIASQELLIDRVPTGLKKAGGVWWEMGYKWLLRGKKARSIEFDKVKTGVPLPPESLKEPARRELKGTKGS